MHRYKSITVKSLESFWIFNIFEQFFLFNFLCFCSPRLHLFYQKYSKTEILLQFTITVFYLNTLHYHVIYLIDFKCCKTFIFQINAVYHQCWKRLFCLIFLWNLWHIFSGFFEKNNNTFLRNVSAHQHIRMISKGSCDTEDFEIFIFIWTVNSKCLN